MTSMEHLDHETDQLDCIAIIGVTGRFPGATTIEQFEKNLLGGVESLTTLTDEQLLLAGVPPELVHSPNYVKTGVVLEGVDLFDAGFFGYTPREAELTDPQHRVFLECAWEAMEDAGYDPERTPLRVGVYAGAGANAYLENNLYSHPDLIGALHHLQKSVATLNDHLSTRVSYKLNLRGPSLTIQTACSSSLVATHIACQSLLNGECDMALAGGVSIRVPQVAGYMYEQGSTFSPDGRCRAFDASAQGMMPGSGVGIVVLKRLADALQDGDTVRAVIRASAINNDGAAKAGYTAPSVEGQAGVIASAQALAGITADEISYVEAMGTGTALGDPIEITALTKAFRRTSQKRGFCAIGSVKTNIGHLGPASGIAGLLKVVAALKNRMLPPSLNCSQPNPAIDFAGSPFYVQQKLEPWQPETGRRLAGVSSFSVGGTNAHLIVEEAPLEPAIQEASSWQLLPISARSPAALENTTLRLAEFLEKHPERNLADAAFTLQQGRKAFAHRRVVVARSGAEAAALLKTQDERRVLSGLENPDASLVFLFPDHVAEFAGAALELYRGEAGFKKHLDTCCELLKPHLGSDLRPLLYPADPAVATTGAQPSQTAAAESVTFVVEYALARLWMDWGVKPAAMIGHGVGEYVAACLAGVFSLEQALKLVCARARLIERVPAGAMLAVQLEEKAAQKYLSDNLSFAALNGPETVFAGPAGAIQELQLLLAKEQIACQLMSASAALHSPAMELIREPLRRLFADVQLGTPQIPYLSNLTGAWIKPAAAADPAYWSEHLCKTVRFAEGIGELAKSGPRIFLEVAPGQSLTALTNNLVAGGHVVLSSLPNAGDTGGMLAALGGLWTAGACPDWAALHAGKQRRRVPLPSYPFERRRYWIEPKKPAISANGGAEEGADVLRQPDGCALGANRTKVLARIGAATGQKNLPQDTDLEGMLAALWHQVLGFETIASDANFFALGGDSLLATQLLSRIRTQLGIELPPNSVFLAPSIAAQAKLIAKTVTRGAHDVVVPLQKGSESRPPFFMIHSYHLYNSLPGALGRDQPFYGVEEFAVSDPVDNWSLESMMSRYVEGIRGVEPHGPYFIGGFCSAAIPALEVARQLQEAGECVPLLVIIDPVGTRKVQPRRSERLRSELASTVAFWRFHIGKLRALPASGVVRYTRELATAKLRNFVTNRKMWFWRRVIRLYMRFGFKIPNLLRRKLISGIRVVTLEAIRNHSPKPYRGDIAIFVAHEMDLELQLDYVTPWREATSGNVKVIRLPGGHSTAFVEPNLAVFAQEMIDALDASIGEQKDALPVSR